MTQNIYEQTVSLRTSGQLDQALKLATRMVKSHRLEPLAWIELAACRALKFDFLKSKQAIYRALKVGDDRLEIHLSAVSTMSTCGYPSGEFLELLKKSVALHPTSLQLKTILGLNLEHRHQVDDAEQLANEVLAKNSIDSRALLLRAVICKRQNNAEKALETIEQLLDTTPNSTEFKDLLYRAHYLRIDCLDSLKRYDEATQAFRDTAYFIQNNCASDVSACQRTWEQRKKAMLSLNQNITPEYLEAWQNHPPSVDQSICFLSGHPRSGTTLAGTILSSHPDTEIIDEKDIFFNDTFIALLKQFPQDMPDIERLHQASAMQISRRARGYLNTAEKFTGQSLRDKTIIDKQALHIFSLPATLRFFPQAQHVVSMRDPRAVALSCLLTNTSLNAYSVNWIDPLTTAQAYDHIMGVWDIIQNWNLPQVHTLRYESLIANQEETTRKLAGQLDLSWNDSLINYQQKAKSQSAVTPTYEQVTRPIYKTSLEKWRNYENLLEPAMPLLEKAASRMGY